MADPRAAIAKRELRVLASEKTIVLALLIQLFIAAFSSFLVVGLVSLYDPGNVGGVQVEVAVTGETVDELTDAIRERPGLVAVPYRDERAAQRAFESGRVDAVLSTQRWDERVYVDAVVPDSNIETTVIVVQVRDALRAYERAEQVERSASLSTTPLPLPSESEGSPYFGFTYTVLVPLLLFLPVFISGSIAVDSLTEERERGTLELLRVAPVTLADIVDGKLVAAAGIAPVQAALWLALLSTNGTPVGSPGLLLALVAATGALVVSMGLAVALLAPDRRAAQFLYSIGVLLAFGGSTLLPSNPANTAARLAIDSASSSAPLVVVASVALAGLGYLLVRLLVVRVDASGL